MQLWFTYVLLLYVCTDWQVGDPNNVRITITNDGATILRSVPVENPAAKVSLLLLRSSNRVNVVLVDVSCCIVRIFLFLLFEFRPVFFH